MQWERLILGGQPQPPSLLALLLSSTAMGYMVVVADECNKIEPPSTLCTLPCGDGGYPVAVEGSCSQPLAW